MVQDSKNVFLGESSSTTACPSIDFLMKKIERVVVGKKESEYGDHSKLRAHEG